jgi:hypothetical protein
MGSLKKLQAVAHDIAHHAQSSLSFVHPHLGEACSEAGVLDVSIELLDVAPYPTGLSERAPLTLALGALHQRFLELLSRYDLSAADLSGARLEFRFKPERRDHYSCHVRSVLTAKSGRVYDRALF